MVCKQLGYHAAALALRGATYIFSSKNTLKGMNIQWIENVQCQGTESRLHECPHNVSFTPGPVLEAGVICESSSLGTNSVISSLLSKLYLKDAIKAKF